MSPEPDPQTEARILAALGRHAEQERTILASYEQLIDTADDEGVRYLGRLIIEDEERHHELISDMINRVDSWALGDRFESGAPALSPRVDRPLLEATRRLIALERRDAHELRQLQRELRDVPATSLLPLLTKLMLQDTARHIEILRFIRTYTG
jgi:hypothetical protein